MVAMGLKRVEIVLDERDYRKMEQAAGRERITVSEWIRLQCGARQPGRGGRREGAGRPRKDAK